MNKYGKINFFGDLVIATNIIQNNNEIIVNPTNEEYVANGYKMVVSDEMLPSKEDFNIEKYYEEDETSIHVRYRYVENTDNDMNIVNDEEISEFNEL